MKKSNAILISLILTSVVILISCNENKTKEKEIVEKTAEYTMNENPKMELDKRISLKLNPMQKSHQAMNMRSHLEAVQIIVTLLSSEKYDEASKVAYTKLGSTTEMKLMCASFGDINFENLGLEFHKSADKMSEIFKSRNKNKSLEALSNTLNYCVQCHSTYKQ
jgi:hypothetical protein